MTREDKKQECKKCGRVFGSVKCFDIDCPNNTPKNNTDKKGTKKELYGLLYEWFVREWNCDNIFVEYLLSHPGKEHSYTAKILKDVMDFK